jgi:hypothetical protein
MTYVDDTLYNISTFAKDELLVMMYCSSRMFGFLKPKVNRVNDERGLLVGCIMRTLHSGGDKELAIVSRELGLCDFNHTLKEVKAILTQSSISKLRLIYKMV